MESERVPNGFAPGVPSLLAGTVTTSRPEAGQRYQPPPDSRQAAAIVEQARAQALFEASRVREQAAAAAEQAKVVILEQARAQAREEAERRRAEALAEATRTKEALLAESREQAFYEGTRLREEATAEIRQMMADGRRAAIVLADEARAEADRIREQAISEAERVKTAIVEHARELAESEAARRREEGAREGEEVRATMIELARKEAERVRADAEQEKLATLAEAEDEAVRLHLEAAANACIVTTEDLEVKLLRASDVGSRDFPQARHGFDPESVRKWLKLVETSYSRLEEELDRARREWERALEILEATSAGLDSMGWDGRPLRANLEQQLEAARGAWERSMATLSPENRYAGNYDLASLLVRASQLEARLGKRPYGYSPSQVQLLLQALTTELARLDNQVGVLRADNDELMRRLLAQTTRPASQLTVLDLLSPAVACPPSALGAGPSANGARPSSEEHGDRFSGPSA